MPTTSIDPVVAKNLKDTLKRIGRSAYSVAVALRRPPNWLYQITSGKYSISIAALREMADEIGVPLEVWPESHWLGFALREPDVLQSYTTC